MINPSDPKSIALRIRGLLGGQDRGVIAAAARRLGVSEVALRITIDDIEPHPTLEVILAVVREYGIDPTWLLTGEYDPTSHRLAVDEEASFSRSDLAKLLVRSREHNGKDPDGGGGPDIRLEA
ncbi:MAG TPA: hypothetical protein VHB25_07825 [Gemmatimonadaceae bacterium]|nr:hypothetical protein [Gemmatimonadaceae bacterium]